MKSTIKNLPKSEVEASVVFDEKEFEKYHNQGFKKIQELTNVDGFRKGNAPEDVIVKAYGDMIILEEMANFAIHDAYVEVIKEHKLIPVADPKVTITKLAKGNSFEFNMVIAVMPEVKLPDYKKLSQEKIKGVTVESVTDKDIEDVIEELRKGRANKHEHEHVHDENCDHSKDEEGNSPSPSLGTQASPALPELNDEFAQSFGGNFKTLEDLKTKIGENLKLEKEQKQKEKVRSVIMEGLISETKAELPDSMIEQELNNMMSQFKHDVVRYGGKFEDYLKRANKTEVEIRNDWRNDAVKRAMSQLVLAEISLVEKIKPTDEEIETELVKLLATVQDVDENRAKAYIYQALTNEKVLAFLEKSA